MNEQEATCQMGRITRFRDLETARGHILDAIESFEHEFFTGAWRESRQVDALKVWFSKTKGGADAVDMEIWSIRIEASDLAQFMLEKLRDKLKAINEEIEKI